MSQQLIHYAKTLKIKDLKPVIIFQLVKNQRVQSIGDLYNLTFKELQKWCTISAYSAETLHKSLRRSRSSSFINWILAYGIPGLTNRQTATKVALYIRSFDAFMNLGYDKTPLIQIIDPKKAQQLSYRICSHMTDLKVFKRFSLKSPRIIIKFKFL